MKFDPEEIKKIVLSTLLFGALLYGYFAFLLGPLTAREKKAQESLKALEPQIAAANSQVTKVEELEAQAPELQQTFDKIKSMIPEGAPVAWFPPRITDFFKRQGFDKCSVRMNNEFPDKDLPGFRRIFWAIELPKVEFPRLAVAVAALENEHPLLEINHVQIEELQDDVQFQRAVLTVSTIVTQQ